MAYKVTLGMLRTNSGVQGISGVCHDSARFRDQINEVTERLMNRGNWWQTEQLLRICYTGCHVVFPQIVGTILGAKFCCTGSVPIRNQWFEIAGPSGGGWCGNATIVADGTRPCHREITGNAGKPLRLHIVAASDIGKTVRIYGKKFGNQPLQTQLQDGTWEDGIVMVASQLDTQTAVLVTKIESVVKEKSNGRFFLYEVEPDGALLDLAMWEPSETNPSFRCYVVRNSGPGKPDAYGRCVRQMECLVKLAHIPATNDEDFVFLDNVAAIKLGVMALRREDSSDDVASEVAWSKAIRELNMELRNRLPSAQTVIRTSDLSSDYVFSNPI